MICLYFEPPEEYLVGVTDPQRSFDKVLKFEFVQHLK